MIIRQEEEKDFEIICNLVKTAFESANVKDGDEHIYVGKLRESNKYLPKLALVAEDKDKIIGHIMFTKMYICGEMNYEQLLLSPLCVAIEHRNKGIGGKLINEGFRIGRQMGYKAVFLCGDPNYYNKFGFQETANYNIFNTGDIEQKYVLCCELIPDALKFMQGKINIV